MALLQEVLGKVRLNEVLLAHAVFCGVAGTLLVLSPHSSVGQLSGTYSHFAHEIIRCYGALTLAQGWMTFSRATLQISVSISSFVNRMLRAAF